MWKAIVLAVFGLAILCLQFLSREPYYPYRLCEETGAYGTQDSLLGLCVVDLDGDGVHEKIASYCKKEEGWRHFTIDVLGRDRFLLSGGQRSFHRDISVFGAFRVSDDGPLALFLTEGSRGDLSLASFRYAEPLQTVARYRRPAHCADTTWMGAGLGIIGTYFDSVSSRYLAVCRLDVPKCDPQRRYFLVDPNDPSYMPSTYPMGVHPGHADLHDTDSDGMPELLLYCGSDGNGISANGTSDSFGYVIALDHDLREIWKSKLGTHLCTVHGALCRNENGFRSVVGVNHDSTERKNTLILFDVATGGILDTLAVDGRTESIACLGGRADGGKYAIASTNHRGEVLSVDISGDRLAAVRKRFGATKTHILGSIELANPPIRGIAISDRSSGDAYIADARLRALAIIPSRAGKTVTNLYAIRRTDGAERLIHSEGNRVYVSRVERTSMIRYAAGNFWGALAYAILVAALSVARYARKPDTLEGQLKLLEHLRISAFHGELSLVTSLKRLARLLEMMGRTNLESAELVNQFRTELRAYRSKWNEDLAAVIAISGQYGLCRNLLPDLRSRMNGTRRILEGAQSAVDAKGSCDPERLNRYAEELKAICPGLADALASILEDLDKAISCDIIAVSETAIELFREREKSGGIRYELSVRSSGPDILSPDPTARRTDPGRSGKELYVRMPERDLYTILDNLLSNASRAVQGSEAKKIELALSTHGHHAAVVVRDTGCGIDPDTVPVLFDLGHTTKRSGGTGLYYVRRTVERYGGGVFVKSEGLGKGAEITFTVPLASASAGRSS